MDRPPHRTGRTGPIRARVGRGGHGHGGQLHGLTIGPRVNDVGLLVEEAEHTDGRRHRGETTMVQLI